MSPNKLEEFRIYYNHTIHLAGSSLLPTQIAERWFKFPKLEFHITPVCDGNMES